MASSGKWIEGIGPSTSIADAARRSLESRLTTVTQCLPLAAYLAAHDIEYVHRLRVATRRAVAAIKLYRDCLADKPSRWMKKQLKKIRQAAGDARDLDVLAIRIAEEYGEPAAPIVDFMATRREAVQPAIVEVAESCRRDDRFVRKTSKLLESIRSPKKRGDDSNADADLGGWALHRLNELSEPFFAATPNENSDVVALHQFRIRGKSVRYAIELLASAFGPELKNDVYPVIEELQERLGHAQDHVTARQHFQAWAAHESSEPRRRMLGELAEAEGLRLQDEVRDFHHWWDADRVEWIRSVLRSQSSENAPQDAKVVTASEHPA